LSWHFFNAASICLTTKSRWAWVGIMCHTFGCLRRARLPMRASRFMPASGAKRKRRVARGSAFCPPGGLSVAISLRHRVRGVPASGARYPRSPLRRQSALPIRTETQRMRRPGGDGRRGCRGTTRSAGSGGGVHPAMIRTHSRALEPGATPGNRRRNSMMADSSPSSVNTRRMAAAAASSMANMLRDHGLRVAANASGSMMTAAPARAWQRHRDRCPIKPNLWTLPGAAKLTGRLGRSVQQAPSCPLKITGTGCGRPPW